jgi:hypothetical protein
MVVNASALQRGNALTLNLTRSDVGWHQGHCRGSLG